MFIYLALMELHRFPAWQSHCSLPLTCCAQYNVTVVGKDSNGTSTAGNNTLQFTTPAAPPPPAPFRCAVRLSLRHLNCACMAWPHMLLGQVACLLHWPFPCLTCDSFVIPALPACPAAACPPSTPATPSTPPLVLWTSPHPPPSTARPTSSSCAPTAPASTPRAPPPTARW